MFFYRIKKIITEIYQLVATGDFNVRIDRQIQVNAAYLVDILYELCLSQHVTSETQQSGGTLDLVITSCQAQVTSLRITDPGITDHKLISCIVDSKRTNVKVRATSCSLSIRLSLLKTKSEQLTLVMNDDGKSKVWKSFSLDTTAVAGLKQRLSRQLEKYFMIAPVHAAAKLLEPRLKDKHDLCPTTLRTKASKF